MNTRLNSSFNLIAKVFTLIGRRALFCFALSAAAGHLLAWIELGFVAFFQVFLHSCGLVPSDAGTIPLLTRWEPSPWQLALFLLLVGLLRGLGPYVISQSAAIAGETVSARLRLISLYEMLRCRRFVSSVEMSLRIAEVFPKATSFFYTAVVLISRFFESTLLLFMIFACSWKDALLGSIGLAALSLPALRINTRLHATARFIPVEHEALLRGILRVIRNWMLVKALRVEEKEYTNQVGGTLAYSRRVIRANLLAGLHNLLPNVLGVILLVLIVFTDMEFWKTPALILVSFLYLFMRFAQSLADFSASAGTIIVFFPQAKQAIAHALRFSDEELREAVAPARGLYSFGAFKAASCLGREVAQSPPESIHPPLPERPPKIEVVQASFGYGADGPLVLGELSFSLEPGTQLGIVGRSGSGKSTLLGLLLGVIQPVCGQIRIAGASPEEFFTRPGACVGYVGPEAFLIEGSIRENLDYGSNRVYSEEEHHRALLTVGLGDFVKQLPGGLDYGVDENGSGLSTGQKQRLALARALLCKPVALFLDEVSANIDPQSEAEIANALRQLKGACTVVAASHKPGLLLYADQILDLSKESCGGDKCSERRRKG